MRAKEFILEVNTSLGNKYQELYTQYYKRAHLKARQEGLTGADADRVARLALDRYKDRVRTGEWDPINRKKGPGRAEYSLEEQLDEDWRHVVTGAGLASMLAGGGSAIYDKMQDTNKVAEPQAHVKQVQAPQANVKAPVAKPQAQVVDTKKAVEHAKDLMEIPAAKYLHKAAVASGLKGSELAQFMAQCAHETANFSTLKEFGDKNYFKKYDKKYNPEKAKVLGNVNVGDGDLYKGRGFIQLTGRENYRNAGKALGLPLEKHPELVERPDVAAKVALWFWKNRVKPNVDNFNNTADATKPINPALKGLTDRQNKFTGMKVAATQAPTTLAKTAAQAPSVKPATKPTTVAAKTAPKATTLAKAPAKTAPAAKAAVKQPVKVAAAKPVTKAKKV